MSTYQGLIQTIVVAKSGTHEEMVEAVARASVHAWLATPDNPAWAPWLAGSFGKTIRRARPIEIDRAKDHVVSAVRVGDAEAFACLPHDKETMPATLRRLQVGGTNRPRGTWATPTPRGDSEALPWLTINNSLEMSTGKTAAQVAHALFAWARTCTTADLNAWQDAGSPMRISEVDLEGFTTMRNYRTPVICIEDAGHTEVAPNSPTVLTWPRR
jgi:peptidyl-tRNA hydrolase